MLGRWDMGRSIWYGLCPYLHLQGMEERPEIPQGQPAVSSQVCRGVVLLPKPSKEPPATHTHRHTHTTLDSLKSTNLEQKGPWGIM